MSFVITLFVREGIVMASDSRLTLSSTEQQGLNTTIRLDAAQSDWNYKTFITSNEVGISTFGAGDIAGVPISGFIQAFIEEQVQETDPVAGVPQKLLDYFRAQLGPPMVAFHLAAYETDALGHRTQFVWRVDVASNAIRHMNAANAFGPVGAIWDGESDVLMRLIPPVQVLDAAGTVTSTLQAASIPWTHFTLQDAIDFAVYAVRTTSDTIRFQIRPKTVGGPIDVLVIRPSGPRWIQRKELHV